MPNKNFLCLHQKLVLACDFWDSPSTCTTWGLSLSKTPSFKSFVSTRLLLGSISLHQNWGLWISIKENFRATKLLEIDCSISLCLGNVEIVKREEREKLTGIVEGGIKKQKKNPILQQHCIHCNVFFVLKAWWEAPPPSVSSFRYHTLVRSHTQASRVRT